MMESSAPASRREGQSHLPESRIMSHPAPDSDSVVVADALPQPRPSAQLNVDGLFRASLAIVVATIGEEDASTPASVGSAPTVDEQDTPTPTPTRRPKPSPTPTRASLGHSAAVSADTWTGGDWPLTIDAGVLTCISGIGAVFITDHNGAMWPLNGGARAHYARFGAEPATEPIWRVDQQLTEETRAVVPFRINIGPLIQRGLALCGQ